ncbi:MAG TPA: type I-C CRISPR-associated protein Cas8c/Csd1 [Candidatus Sumerlaeota bacterium]|nr:type I-C CRISPR-associated protein Cas8c/Csd1 [Candidatus Sumerlaeota bacterium]
MLHQLVQYARDHNLAVEPGFKPKDVRWLIVLDDNGQFLDIMELGDTDDRRNKGRSFLSPDMSQPQMKSGGIIKSHFLTDALDVVLLYGKNADDPKTIKKHEYFKNFLLLASSSMPVLKIMSDVLTDADKIELIRQRAAEKKIKDTDKITFQIGDILPLETSDWHDWWRSFLKNLSGQSGDQQQTLVSGSMRCFISGGLVDPEKTHPKISGLGDVGGQASGSVMIGFDKDSFASYNLEQSKNAAVSVTMAAAYRAALDHLIKNSAKRFGGVKIIHWFKGKIADQDDPLSWLEETGEQAELNAIARARKMLESIHSGERPDLKENYYYSMTMSGAGGRVMLRDWMEGRFENLVENILCWFEDLSIVNVKDGALAPPCKFLAVLGSTVRVLDDLAAPHIAAMLRVAIRQEMIPMHFLAAALNRFKINAIQDNYIHAASPGLLKAYHIRKNRMKGGLNMSDVLKPGLNEDHPDPAYHCGRLMAVLAALQRSALGDVGAGIIQRYYAAASATPALVLGRLTRTSQFHLDKLEGGLRYWYQDKIASIWSRIRDYPPRMLNLEEQSLFALGYYQQLADLRTKKSDNSHNEKEQEL